MIADFSFSTRQENIQRLANEMFDLVIIGGGINGAGVARDAASRGMRVALVEARDFASGTSSRSSKLIHGGIRYLENLEFGLVFEALSERRHLFEIAPHLVHPLRFVIPLYQGGRVGPFKLGLGMWLYDALALFETPEPHEHLKISEVKSRLPQLRVEGLSGAFAYSDAYMDDDRLVIETLRSAHQMGAVMANYVEAAGARLENGRITQIQVRDKKSDASFFIKARHVVSTVGPWTDQLAPRLVGDWTPHMRPTKGVHLTFARQRIPLTEAVVMAAEERIVFAIPRHEMVIVGTTDTAFAGNPEDVHSEPEDVDYLLGVMGRYFPHAKIRESDIIASYAGVRPLVDDRARTESKTSREHQILFDERNVTFVMGGKYTTYRLIAEQAVRAALNAFSLEDQVRFARGQTLVPLNPLVTPVSYADRDRQIELFQLRYEISNFVAAALFDRHGPETESILARHLSAIEKSSDIESLWALEALHAIEQTMCLSVADFFLRRTPLVLARPDHGAKLRAIVGRTFQQRLGLSNAELNSQISELDDHLRKELGWRSLAFQRAHEVENFPGA